MPASRFSATLFPDRAVCRSLQTSPNSGGLGPAGTPRKRRILNERPPAGQPVPPGAPGALPGLLRPPPEQVRPALPGPLEGPGASPLFDLRVVPREQDFGNAPAAVLAGPRVVGVVEPLPQERFVYE